MVNMITETVCCIVGDYANGISQTINTEPKPALECVTLTTHGS